MNNELTIKPGARRRKNAILASSLLALSVIATPVAAQADENAENIAACLKAFGSHPFGPSPEYRTLPVKVKVFGIGQDTIDADMTASDALVFIKASVNVMGGSIIQLGNPKGWYCMQSSVNVMGGLTIKLACNAKFAIVSGGTSVLSNDASDKGITVMGSTTIERDC